MSDLKVLNVKIRADQHDNLKKLALISGTSIACAVRGILDTVLGTVDAMTIIVKHLNGKEEKL